MAAPERLFPRWRACLIYFVTVGGLLTILVAVLRELSPLAAVIVGASLALCAGVATDKIVGRRPHRGPNQDQNRTKLTPPTPTHDHP